MGLFGLFGKSPRQREAEASRRRAEMEDLEIYSGMRVEVTSQDGRMFLTAKLLTLRGDRIQLQPYTDCGLLLRGEDPIPVTIRGYSSKEGRAVQMEASIRMGANKLWQAEHLTLVKTGNDRAAFRLNTDVTAYITPLIRFYAEEERCRLLNISVGGACIGSQKRHNVGDKFLLQVSLLPEQEPLQANLQILRIIERLHDYFEYGCRFLDVDPAKEERIQQTIYELQRKKSE